MPPRNRRPARPAAHPPTQPTLPLQPSADERLDVASLETWLWDAACAIRGATDAPKFKDFILPLVFSKRLSDVFDDEFARHVESFGDEDVARAVIEADHADALRACDTKVAAVEREAELSDELFRALPEALMTGRLSAVPLTGARLG